MLCRTQTSAGLTGLKTASREAPVTIVLKGTTIAKATGLNSPSLEISEGRERKMAQTFESHTS